MNNILCYHNISSSCCCLFFKNSFLEDTHSLKHTHDWSRTAEWKYKWIDMEYYCRIGNGLAILSAVRNDNCDISAPPERGHDSISIWITHNLIFSSLRSMSTVCRVITAHTRIQHPVCRAICVWKIIADFSLRVFLPLPHTINGWVNFQTSAIKIYFSSRLHRVGRSILSEWNSLWNRLTRWRGKSNQPNESNNNNIVKSNRTNAKLAPFILTFQSLNAAHATASSSSSEYFFPSLTLRCHSVFAHKYTVVPLVISCCCCRCCRINFYFRQTVLLFGQTFVSRHINRIHFPIEPFSESICSTVHWHFGRR